MLLGVRGGKGQYLASCPSHPDEQASLSVGLGANGAVLLHCHAGCPTPSVLRALGLQFSDLFPASKSGTRWLRWHVYRDVDGGPIYSVSRGVSAKGQRRWRMHGFGPAGWTPRRTGPKILYRLPELVRDPCATVFITEGERDADTLAELGLVATTVASSSWNDVDTSHLLQRQVWIVVDADPAGWKRGSAARAAANAAGATVLGVLQPAEGYKDITEQVAASGIDESWRPADLESDAPAGDATRHQGVSRSAFRDSGLALYVQAPTGVLLGLVQRKELRLRDLGIWLLLEERAGRSGEAHLSAIEIGRVLGMDRRAVSEGLARLTASGLTSTIRRGLWRVHNPAVMGRHGTVDPALIFVDRVRTQTLSLPSTPSITSPASERYTATGEAPNVLAAPVRARQDVAETRIQALPMGEHATDSSSGGPEIWWLAN